MFNGVQVEAAAKEIMAAIQKELDDPALPEPARASLERVLKVADEIRKAGRDGWY